MGFRHVESGPLVRSSYHAHEQAESIKIPRINNTPRRFLTWEIHSVILGCRARTSPCAVAIRVSDRLLLAPKLGAEAPYLGGGIGVSGQDGDTEEEVLQSFHAAFWRGMRTAPNGKLAFAVEIKDESVSSGPSRNGRCT